MDDEKNKVASAAMVELKAELYRKQEEFRNKKTVNSGYVRAKKGERGEKKSLWSAKNKGVLARAAKDEVAEESYEDEDVMLKSKSILEQKAKLYQKITSSSNIPEEDGSDYYLVDFQKKHIDSIEDEREKKRKQDEEAEEEAERRALDEAVPPPSTPDEEWVDFTDSLGRSRRCMRKDLDVLKRRDQELARTQTDKQLKSAPDSSAPGEVASLMSEDMHREKMRRKWEEETQALMEQEHGQTHYSNVRFDEIRNHGVGFYEFSKDHETREEQMENLRKMREETLDERSKQEKIKDKRKALMEARLAKVRQRRNLKPGGSVEDLKGVNDDKAKASANLEELSEKTMIDTKIKEEKEKEEAEAEEKRKAYIRDWDKGKPKGLSQKSYVEVRRDEREDEFAPPSTYFAGSKFQKPGRGHVGNEQRNFSDKKRLERLQKSMSGVNPEFAPPSSYNKDTGSHRQSVPVKPYSVNIKIDINSSKLGTNVDDIPNQAKVLGSESDDILSSIPLPPNLPLPKSSDQKNVNESKGISTTATHNVAEQSHTITSNNGQFSQDKAVWHTQPGCTAQVQHDPGRVPTLYHTPNSYLCGESNSSASYTHQQQYPNDYYHYGGCSNQNDGSIVSTQYEYQEQNTGAVNQAEYLNPTPHTAQQRENYGYAPSYPSMAPDYTNYSGFPPTTSTPISKQYSTKLGDNTENYKRSYSQESVVDGSNAKISKVPKSSIVDTRFFQNKVEEDTCSEMTPAEKSVTAVPYTPGSFTAARQAVSSQYEETVHKSRAKSQICGGPLVYTEQQRLQQLKEQEEEEAAQKVDEFLCSLK